MPVDTDEARRDLIKEIMNQVLEGPTSRLPRDPRELPARELPPGTWGGLYVLYQAFCLAAKERPASRALFYEIKKQWKDTLTFRRRSQHSTCTVCDKLKADLRHAKSFVQHCKAADTLLGHLATTWRCREIYWGARQQSRSRDNILTLICDGYDKSKPAIPRWSRGRPPKGGAFERIARTHLQLSAVICHGWGVIVFLAEEPVSTGGSYTWECILHACNEVWHQCCKEGRSLPRTLLGLMERCILNQSNVVCFFLLEDEALRAGG